MDACHFQDVVVLVQLLSCVLLFVTPWTAAHQPSLSFTISQSLLRLMSIESVMPSNRLVLCLPLLPLSSIFPSIRVFSKESVLQIRWPKYWSFSFSISPSNDSSGLISFRMDWLDLLAVQGTLKSLLQHYSLKALILWHLGFFMVQLTSFKEILAHHLKTKTTETLWNIRRSPLLPSTHHPFYSPDPTTFLSSIPIALHYGGVSWMLPYSLGICYRPIFT